MKYADYLRVLNEHIQSHPLKLGNSASVLALLYESYIELQGFENEQIHFQYIGNGGGSASALPIWGLFMKKVTSDPSLSRYYDKVAFDRPVGYDLNISCTGEDSVAVIPEDMPKDNGTPVFDGYEEDDEQYFD